jgi:hypothetical protein
VLGYGQVGIVTQKVKFIKLHPQFNVKRYSAPAKSMPVSYSPAHLDIAELPDILRQLTSDYSRRLQGIDERSFQAKPDANKWSKKEIIGHLIDSAQNNLRRFITAQYEARPPHIVYNQDLWVAANGYNEVPTADLILLWRLLNERIAAVLDRLPDGGCDKLCNVGKNSDNFRTLNYLANDYIGHARHHLNQIFD